MGGGRLNYYKVGNSHIQEHVQCGAYIGMGTSHMQEPIQFGAYQLWGRDLSYTEAHSVRGLYGVGTS